MNALREWLESLQGSGIRPGLSRMRALLRILGKPQHSYPSIIVAGTNGKGSTCAALTSILLTAGYRAGLYTSPHLVDIRERWSIDGQPISEELFDAAIRELQHASHRAGITPTYFEALTIIAFVAFRRAGCQVVVLEVGMGGRMDATNVVRPLAALITPVGMDHTEYLGNTLRKIAAEKAGVIHRGAIALTTNEDPVVLEVLRRRARRFDVPLRVVKESLGGDVPLRGEFQRRNLALAAAAAEALRPYLPRINEDSIRRGIAATRWRGRLELFPAGTKQIWVDGCHNAHAARAIAPFIEKTLPPPRGLLFGIMADKQPESVAEVLFPLFDSILCTEPYRPRSEPAVVLAELAKRYARQVQAIQEPRQALDAALALDVRSLLITGSLYLAGAAVEYLDALHQRE